MGGEGCVDGRYHVVLVLGHGVGVILHGVWVAGLHRGHVCLHGEQRAVHGRVLVVRDVDAAKVASAQVAVHDMAIGEDVGEGAFVAELAVALDAASARVRGDVWCAAYLGEVLARCPLGHGLVRVQERTGLSSLAGALAVELAGDVGCACRRQQLPAACAERLASAYSCCWAGCAGQQSPFRAGWRRVRGCSCARLAPAPAGHCRSRSPWHRSGRVVAVCLRAGGCSAGDSRRRRPSRGPAAAQTLRSGDAMAGETRGGAVRRRPLRLDG